MVRTIMEGMGMEGMGFALNETLVSIRETAARMGWELSEIDLLVLLQANALGECPYCPIHDRVVEVAEGTCSYCGR